MEERPIQVGEKNLCKHAVKIQWQAETRAQPTVGKENVKMFWKIRVRESTDLITFPTVHVADESSTSSCGAHIDNITNLYLVIHF